MRACVLVALSSVLGCGVANAQQMQTQGPVSRYTGRPLLQMAPSSPESTPPSAAPISSPFQPLSTGTGITFPGFAATPSYVASPAADQYGEYAIVEGEFDGKPGIDVAAVQGDGRINLLLNDGKGHFSPVYGPATTFINASSADGADFNGDGLTDLAVANASTATVSVYLNQSGGQFAAPVVLSAIRPTGLLGTQIIGAVRVGDVNGDGNPDIVFPVAYVNFSTNKSVIVVFTFPGDGHGGFSAPVTTMIPLSSTVFVYGSHSVELADLAHKGKPGLVMELEYESASTQQYAIGMLSMTGNGDGTFTGASFFGPPIPATNLTRGTLSVKDFDGDGNLDVLFADGVNNIELALGKGDGTLKPPTAAITDVGSTVSLVVGDFNRDNILDVVAIQSGLALVFNGTGGGVFNYTPAAQYAGGLAGSQPTASADFDGDGNPDFLWIEPFFNQASFFFGNGDSTFKGTPAITAANAGPTEPNQSDRATDFAVIAAGKYASTSRSDVLLDEGGHIGYGKLQGSNGAMQMSTAFAAPQLTDVDFVEPLAVDLNGDGYTDVVMATLSGIKVSLSNGDGTFGQLARTKIPVQLGCILGLGAAGDLNGDGKVDLVFGYTGNSFCYATGTSPSGYAVLLGDGKGGFTSSTFVPYGYATGTVRLADVNGDGILDMILIDVAYSHYSVTVLRGIGDGTFDVTHPYNVYSSAQYAISDLKALDMDGDGKVDLVMSYYGASGTQAVLLAKGNGDFTFSMPASMVTGATGQYLEVADFNGDGLPDVAVTLQKTSSRVFHDIALILNTGNDTFATPLIYVMPTDASNNYNKNLFSGDFNGDGAMDLITGNGNFKVPSALFLSSAGSTWTLSAQPSAPTQGVPVQLIAQGTPLASTLTGSVQFSANGKTLGTATISNNVATLTASALPAGTDVVSAQYSGDATHFSTTIAPITLQVATITPAFSLTSYPMQLAVFRGQTGSMNLTVSANASFQGSISFTCNNLPAYTTCAFSPSSVTLSQGTTGATTLTVTTSGSASLRNETLFGTGKGILLAGLLLLPLTYRRRKLFASATFSVVLFAIIGCAGNSGNQTPRGTSFVTVNATATTTTGTQLTQTLSVPITIN